MRYGSPSIGWEILQVIRLPRRRRGQGVHAPWCNCPGQQSQGLVKSQEQLKEATLVRTGRTMTTYRGQRIIRCNWEEGRHRGAWYIQTYHSPTGMAWSDEECPHYDSIAGAKESIKDSLDGRA